MFGHRLGRRHVPNAIMDTVGSLARAREPSKGFESGSGGGHTWGRLNHVAALGMYLHTACYKRKNLQLKTHCLWRLRLSLLDVAYVTSRQ